MLAVLLGCFVTADSGARLVAPQADTGVRWQPLFETAEPPGGTVDVTLQDADGASLFTASTTDATLTLTDDGAFDRLQVRAPLAEIPEAAWPADVTCAPISFTADLRADGPSVVQVGAFSWTAVGMVAAPDAGSARVSGAPEVASACTPTLVWPALTTATLAWSFPAP